MTFQDFITKYNGQYLEVAGTDARNQCVDLANGYLRDVLNHPIVEFTNAAGASSAIIDDVALFNRALTASDVDLLYNGPKVASGASFLFQFI